VRCQVAVKITFLRIQRNQQNAHDYSDQGRAKH
jgi:hypothetical protein